MSKIMKVAFLFGVSCLASHPTQAEETTETAKILAPHPVEIVRDWITTGSWSYQVVNDGVIDRQTGSVGRHNGPAGG